MSMNTLDQTIVGQDTKRELGPVLCPLPEWEGHADYAKMMAEFQQHFAAVLNRTEEDELLL